MQQRSIELTVGLFIVVALAAFFMLALKVSGLSNFMYQNSYQINANFDNIGSLKPRAPVAIAGVKIGQVVAINLDKTTYRATVLMRIDGNQNTLPTDSSASILTEGLLGSNYISVTPGFDETYLKAGDVIQNTHPAIVLESLIGQLMFKLSSGDTKKKD